jgi:adenine-specific DNA-methyltransferase
MKLQIRKLQTALNPAYRKQTVKREDMDAFKLHLRNLLRHINPDESEENAKGHLSTFLKGAFYGADYLIATKERADLVIHSGPRADSPAAVLVETKRPRPQGQTAADMLRPDKPNVKALHELILYFLRERVEATQHRPQVSHRYRCARVLPLRRRRLRSPVLQ